MTEPNGRRSSTTTVLRNGRTVDRTSIVDLTVTDGIIVAIEPSTERTAQTNWDQAREPGRAPALAATVVDLGGRLVVPSMAEPHAHLDKALVADEVANPTGDLIGAIDAMDRAAGQGLLSHDAVVERAALAVELMLARGVTDIRSHINVGDGFGAAYVRAATEVRDRVRHMVDLELVALTHSPVTGTDGTGNRRALAEAIEAGVDVVGGCPHLEDDPEGSIDLFLEAGAEAGIGLDLHMDETLDPAVFHLDYLARRVLDTGFDRPVVAGHSVTLGLQDVATQERTARLLARAGIAVVALPQTNLFLQGRDHPVATPRALAPVAVLQEAGVTVTAGGDNMQDPFNPMGRGDQLEIANLMVLTTHRRPEVAFDMVSNQVRAMMGRPPVEVAVGSRADLVAVPASGIRHALATQPHDRLVFKAGRLVASSTATTTIHHHHGRPDDR
jgi:cytosine deaminase